MRRMARRMSGGRRRLGRMRDWARGLKRQAITLWFVSRHPDTPWPAKAVAAVAVAYALSPIDLIPDFVPLLGMADELVLLPLALALALRLTPAQVRAECAEAAARSAERPVSRAGALLVLSIWALLLASVALLWCIWAEHN